MRMRRGRDCLGIPVSPTSGAVQKEDVQRALDAEDAGDIGVDEEIAAEDADPEEHSDVL